MKHIPFIFLLLLAAGCAHVVSDQLRTRTDPDINIASLFRDPEAYEGSLVIIGGTIADSINRKDGTYLEIVEKPLDYRGRPKLTDQSLGRFIVHHDGFLDTAIYSRGKHVTVAGEVAGKKIQPLGEINYSYLFIKNRELHLVEPGRGLPIHFGVGISSSF